jgi:hypothetical protein
LYRTGEILFGDDLGDASSVWALARAAVHGRLAAQCDELRQDDWLPIVVINT